MNSRAIRVLEFNKILKSLENYCVSSDAKIMASELSPSTSKYEVLDNQKRTSEATELVLKVSGFHLGKICDIKNSVKAASIGSVLFNEALLDIADTLRTARNLKNAISTSIKNEIVALEILGELSSRISVFQDIEKEIGRCIKSADEIFDDASPRLSNIRREIVSKSLSIRKKLDSFVTDSNNQKYLQEAIVTMRSDRFVVPVKAEYRSVVKGMIHDTSGSGQTLYIEPMEIVNLNNDLKNLSIDEKNEIEIILRKLTSLIAASADEVMDTYNLLVEMDFIIAKGRLSYDMNASEPILSDDLYINLKNARHPLIPKNKVVPIKIYIGGDFRSLLITGPNTGGKTVSLKTVGLFVLMFQSGLHIPVDTNSTMPIFDNVFADIGDEQSIEQSLSTFSSHMTNIVDILEHVTPKSLCLFDELGAGTDPTEGAALAMAILNFVHKNAGLSIATTHYSELKKFALVTSGFKNAAVEFDVNTLSPTYRLEIGVPGKSNAFEISRKLGLPNALIEESKKLIEYGDIAFEDVLTEIEEDKRIAKRDRDEALRLKLDLDKKYNDMLGREERIRAASDKIINDAKMEARSIVKRAKAESDEIVKEISELAKLTGTNNKELQEKKRALTELEKENYTSLNLGAGNGGAVPKKLKLGQKVLVSTLNQHGNVVSLPDDKGNCQVQIGLIRTAVNIKDLRLKNGEEITVNKRSIYEVNGGAMTGKSGRGSSLSRKSSGEKLISVGMEIDLRGKNVDEAIMELDKYFDDALLAGLRTVTVIHGVGTGALKKGLEGFIRRHNHVEDSRLGSYGEGGAGVTIVTLK